ncbi:diguanylate cyclase [Vibrio sp. HN007]|uniref:transporter substrate-binding domain-containing diguanylate cyclase n=1 Tax=Vibrio iocasae TaxID=3098914 RepID=UPI0035D3FDC5
MFERQTLLSIIFSLLLIPLLLCLVPGSYASDKNVSDKTASKKRDKVVVVNSASWPPFSFIGEDGEPKGILYDLWTEIGKRQGINVQYVNTAWANSLEQMRSGEAHIHAGLFKSTDRDEYLDFSIPIGIPIATRLFVSSDLEVDNASEIGEYTVGVTRGGFSDGFIKANYPEVKRKAYSTSKDIIDAAISGEIKIFVMDYTAAMYFLHKRGYPTEFQAVETLYMEKLRAAVSEGDENLLSTVNEALNEIPQEEFDRILNKWIQSDRELPDWIVPGFIFVISLLLIMFTVFYILMLKRQVDAKTEKLKALSETDALTGICNRQKFESCFQCEITRFRRYEQVFSLILIDIDDFKLVNDNYGHSVGDDVLVALVNLLKGNIRDSDILARWGGEEFVILCPNTDKDAATSQAKKLKDLISTHEFPVVKKCTVSFGIAEAIEGDDEHEIFVRADNALYASKEGGKNTVTS